jgi:hypothetical protein
MAHDFLAVRRSQFAPEFFEHVEPAGEQAKR